jgi:hypothetical protein
MTLEQKIDKALELLAGITEKQQDHDEQLEELREAIADLRQPGSGYEIIDVED